jgi:hypothetical protein
MAAFRLPHFSLPHVLQAIDRCRLLAFLAPHRVFFANRRLTLPDPDSDDPVPFEQLVRVFMSPDEDTPHELIDALYYIDGMSTPEGMHTLLAAARSATLTLDGGDAVTPADVAVQVWLLDPDLLERTHAEQYLTNPKSFDYFQTDEEHPPQVRLPAPEVVEALERELDDWFVEHRRGRTARVFAFDRPDGMWFLVRHGEPYKREESFQGAEPSSVAYRPLKYDVLVYDPCLGELRIHAQLKGEKDLYRRAFGRHLFGRDDFFPDGLKYTLEPLRTDGERSLGCADVDGLEWARLKELHYSWGGAHSEYEIVRAGDVFAALRDRGNRTIPSSPRLARAVFLLKFRDSKRPRSVTIKPPNVALYARDQDAGLVEEWLQKRGFLNVYPDADDQPPDPLLVVA